MKLIFERMCTLSGKVALIVRKPDGEKFEPLEVPRKWEHVTIHHAFKDNTLQVQCCQAVGCMDNRVGIIVAPDEIGYLLFN